MKAIANNSVITALDFGVVVATKPKTVNVDLEGTEFVDQPEEAVVFFNGVSKGSTTGQALSFAVEDVTLGFTIGVELAGELYEKDFPALGVLEASLPTRIVGDQVNKRVSVIAENSPQVAGVYGVQSSVDVVMQLPFGNGTVQAVFLPFSVKWYRGRYEAKGAAVYIYDFGDRLYAHIEYCVEAVYHVLSVNNDLIYARLHELYQGGCSQQDLTEAFYLASLIAIGEKQGFDVSDTVAKLETILGIKGLGIKGLCEPSGDEGIDAKDIVIDGCNVIRAISGQTTKYRIDNYTYEIDVKNHRGTITKEIEDIDCNKKTTLVFDFDKMAKIVGDAIAPSVVGVVNDAMAKIDPGCVWPVDPCKKSWKDLSFAEKWKAIVDKVCSCVTGGGGGIGTLVFDVDCDLIDVVGDFYAGTPANGYIHVPILYGSGTGTISIEITGNGFQGSASQTITDNTTVIVPVTHNGTGTGTVQVNVLVDGKSCLVDVDLVEQCGPARNLEVIYAAGVASIRFSEAVFPPDNYRVLRRRQSDPDIPGSYTVLSAPVYNIGLNKYVVNETYTSDLQNKKWVYRVESLCNDGTRPYVDVVFANLLCVTPTNTPTDQTIQTSFTHVGGDVNRYRLGLYQSGNLVGAIITISPAFPSPITYLWTSLTPDTNYVVRIWTEIVGEYSTSCDFPLSTSSALYQVLGSIGSERTSSNACSLLNGTARGYWRAHNAPYPLTDETIYDTADTGDPFIGNQEWYILTIGGIRFSVLIRDDGTIQNWAQC